MIFEAVMPTVGSHLVRKVTFSILGFSLIVVSGCVSPLHGVESHTISSMDVRRHTLRELRDRHVVKQETDYSCGAAALATLLLYYYGEDTSEQELLALLEAQIPSDEWGQKTITGFSLLDLKGAAESKGFRAGGFTLTADQITKLTAPVIVFVEPLGYKHFAVLRGVRRGRVYLADPSRGNLRMSLSRFLKEWSGVVFVLGQSGEERLRDYPLALPKSNVLNPEVDRLGSVWSLGTTMQNMMLRTFER